MTYRDALRNTKRWNKRALIINLFHLQMLLRKKKWSQKRTAKKLGISIGQTSEALKLAKAILEMPELEKMRRDEALRSIK
jgi:hypothetical protein